MKSASVTVDGQLISSIGKGMLVLAAISKDDTEKDVESMAGKILKAKLWDDEDKEPALRVSSRTVRPVTQTLTAASGKRASWRSEGRSSVVRSSCCRTSVCGG